MLFNKGDNVKLKFEVASEYPVECRYASFKVLHIKDNSIQVYRSLYSATGKETTDIRTFKAKDLVKLKDPLTQADRLKGFYESFYN